jgi:competence protein ComEC
MNKKLLMITIITLLIFSIINNSVISVNIRVEKRSNKINETNQNDLAVYFIDVGQGDSILVKTPHNTYFLIDTGSRSHASTLINFLNDLNVYTLEAFIATHPHEDHIGGCQELFDEFNIQSVYHPGYTSTSATYQRFLTSAENEGCPIYTSSV